MHVKQKPTNGKSHHYLEQVGKLTTGLAEQTQLKLLRSKMCSWNWAWCAYRGFWREACLNVIVSLGRSAGSLLPIVTILEDRLGGFTTTMISCYSLTENAILQNIFMEHTKW